MTHQVDPGKPVDEIFLNFSKAFNTVSPRILLDKLSRPQLDKHIMGWASNWLMGRAECDRDWGDISLAPVISGVSHGSSLIPVLFNILMNKPDAGLKGILRKNSKFFS